MIGILLKKFLNFLAHLGHWWNVSAGAKWFQVIVPFLCSSWSKKLSLFAKMSAWVYIKSNLPVQEPVIQTNVQNSSKGNSCLHTRPPQKWVHMNKSIQTLPMCLHGIIRTIGPTRSHVTRKWKTQSSYFPKLCLGRQHNYNLVFLSEVSAPRAPGFTQPLQPWLHCNGQRGKCRFSEAGEAEKHRNSSTLWNFAQTCNSAVQLHHLHRDYGWNKCCAVACVCNSFHQIPFCSTW